MCGRFSQSSATDHYRDLFGVSGDGNLPPRYNVAPSQTVLACREQTPGDRELVSLTWGFVPHWARDTKGPKPINARVETAAEKPMFRDSFRCRRCLIPVDGFYEWRSEGRVKQPYFIRRKDGEPLVFAGLWDHWEREGRKVETCTILVTNANDLVRPLHDRMPVILSPEAWGIWLDPAVREPRMLAPLLVPFDADQLEVFPVSQDVNSPANEGPRLIKPLERLL